MKNLKAQAFPVVEVSFEDKEGDRSFVILQKKDGRWIAPTMTYVKCMRKTEYCSTFGLKATWKPTPKMIRAAEKALNAQG